MHSLVHRTNTSHEYYRITHYHYYTMYSSKVKNKYFSELIKTTINHICDKTYSSIKGNAQFRPKNVKEYQNTVISFLQNTENSEIAKKCHKKSLYFKQTDKQIITL